MYKGIFYTHLVSVNLFLLIYLVKTILLTANKEEGLKKFTKITKVPEMIISVLFLLTGAYMMTQIPQIKTLLLVKLIFVFAAIPLAVVGFKKRKKALGIIAFLLIVMAYGFAEMSKKKGNTSVTTAGNETNGVTDGKTIYEIHCKSCHGDDGKLGLMDATNLAASVMSQEEKEAIIKKGKNAMNAFGSVLTDEQVKAVAEYIETLKNND